jgi:RecJ-like exonuclease
MGFLGDAIKNKTRRTCPACKGRGHIPLQKTTKKKGWETVDKKHYMKVKCPACKGKGTILG